MTAPVNVINFPKRAATLSAATELAVLSVGSRGTPVAQLQKQLNAWGFQLPPAQGAPDGVDGIYGNNTRDAVMALQRKLGLKATGVWDATTQKAAAADLAAPTSVIRDNQKAMGLQVTWTPPPTTQTPPTVKPDSKGLVLLLGGAAVAVIAYFSLRNRGPYTALTPSAGASVDEDEGEASTDAPADAPELRPTQAPAMAGFAGAQTRMRKCAAGWAAEKRKKKRRYDSHREFMKACLATKE